MHRKEIQMKDEIRTTVPENETWNLCDIYPTLADWENDYAHVTALISKLNQYVNRIHNAADLYAYLQTKEEATYHYGKLYAFAQLQADLDTRITKAQALLDKVRSLGQNFSRATAFFLPFLLGLEESTLRSYIKEADGLAYFEDDLLEAYRYKHHVLSQEKEELLSQMGEALSAPRNTFSMINNADMRFGDVTDEQGKKIPLTRGMYARLTEHPNQSVRKEAYEAYYKPYVQLENTIASTLSAAIKNNVLLAKLRNYPSALEKALFSDRVPKQVYENLIETAKSHLQPLQTYMEIRKEQLRLENLHAYDLNVPLTKGIKLEISYEDAYKTMLESLTPLGEEYVYILSSFKEKRYIDVRETPGKRSGAYNLGVYGVHPYVLLNHRDDLDSMFTLTHEMGHAMHSYYSGKFQPRIKAGYSIFVAEVASTVNEVLLIQYLLKRADTKSLRQHLLNHFIDQFKGTFFTQVMFAEFEKITHEKAERKEALHAESFSHVYEKLFVTYNADAIMVDPQVKYGWARIPHFYRSFYVYKYATGFVAAIDIAERLLAGDVYTQHVYLEFLKSGSSEEPLVLLQNTGVNLLQPEPIQHAMQLFQRLVTQLQSSYN
ncbi:oligoendopeptidase F [Ectobacillus sp. JY-23]|uniref:oligoendopeptidase F n=1 Tax=Ectobacillus sp. JY-23 TaxID=2933872 RepID=UPI001FF6838D|nr:oligoendopeptidase F [Ectobacillus sp. JY-23]UOY93006.1 oligoendopeptidase F [Ectobacillus sp. JY-23]